MKFPGPTRQKPPTCSAPGCLLPPAADILRGKLIIACRARSPGSAWRVCVDQAAREALSAILTPNTAAGGAEGERCPGSALSCLDEIAGETVEAACEKAVPAPRRRQPASRLRWPGHERSPRRSGQRGRGQGRCDAGRPTEHPQSIVKSGPDPPWGVGGRQGEGAAGKRIETSRNWTACPDAL